MSAINKLFQLAEIQGTNAKKDFLKNNEADAELKEILKFMFDTDNIVSGISDKKLAKDVSHIEDTVTIYSITDLLQHIQANNSGRDKDVAVVKSFAKQFDSETEQAIYNIISQRWTGLGVQRTLLNKVYGPSFISEFAVMLANKYENCQDQYVGKLFHIQDKLDGIRIAAKTNNCTLWTRHGKRKEGFTDIEQALKELGGLYVLDGELQPVGYQDMIAKDAYKLTTNSNGKGEKKNMCFVVYDILTIEEWDSQTCTRPYEERYAQYHELLKALNSPFLIPLTSRDITTDTAKIKTHLDEATASGKEGVMVKLSEATYEWKRTAAICKCKKFFDLDVIIESFEYGTGKNKNVCGSLVFTYKGSKVNVGSGLTDELRKDIAEHFDTKYKGRVAEINYFEETESKTEGKLSLRFPTFKGWKDLER